MYSKTKHLKVAIKDGTCILLYSLAYTLKNFYCLVNPDLKSQISIWLFYDKL